MPNVTFTGLTSLREAQALAYGLNWANDGSISILEVTPTYVRVADDEQEQDFEVGLSIYRGFLACVFDKP